MTNTICDMCEKKLEAHHENPTVIEGHANLIKSDAVMPFSFKIETNAPDFGENFHVCKECIVSAISKCF